MGEIFAVDLILKADVEVCESEESVRPTRLIESRQRGARYRENSATRCNPLRQWRCTR